MASRFLVSFAGYVPFGTVTVCLNAYILLANLEVNLKQTNCLYFWHQYTVLVNVALSRGIRETLAYRHLQGLKKKTAFQ